MTCGERTKKPSPLIARSSVFWVDSMEPWWNCCATVAVVTPLPTVVFAFEKIDW